MENLGILLTDLYDKGSSNEEGLCRNQFPKGFKREEELFYLPKIALSRGKSINASSIFVAGENGENASLHLRPNYVSGTIMDR